MLQVNVESYANLSLIIPHPSLKDKLNEYSDEGKPQVSLHIRILSSGFEKAFRFILHSIQANHL